MNGNTGIISTCGNTIYDNGYLGNYSNNSDDIVTVCAENEGDCMQAEFLLFEVESIIWDQLDVYAGASIDAPLIGSYGGGALPPAIINPGTECLTFHFTSDGSVNFDGYEIYVSCVCPSCDDGILNGGEIGIGLRRTGLPELRFLDY